MAIEVSVLGPPRVDRRGSSVDIGRGGRRVVLCALALAEGRPVASDVLIEEIWGGSAPRNARTIVHGHVSTLRRLLGDEGGTLLQTQGEAYRLWEATLDTTRFRTAVAEGEAAAGRGAWDEAAAAFERAEATWRGDVCQGTPLAGASQEVARELEMLRLRSTTLRIDAQLQLGRHGRVLPELEKLVSDHPLDEHLAGRLALARFQAGRQADAIEGLRRIRAQLREELGVDPKPELAEIQEAIVRQDPALRPEHTVDVLRRSHTRWISAVRVRLLRGDPSTPVAPIVSRIEEVLRRSGGDVTAIPGEGVLGVWGLREPEADVAMRAVRAAESVFALQVEITPSIAVATAKAQTHEAEPEAALMDATAVYLAAALVRAAAPGEILVDDITADLLDPAFPRRRRGNAFLVASAEQPPFELRGRARELSMLRDAFDGCATHDRSGCVLLLGPGGIGKTSLAQVFAEQTHVRTVVIRCEREPVGEMLMRLIDALADTPPTDATVESLFLAARSGILRAAEEGPLVVIVDDLHHIGDTAASAIGRLARSTRRHPVLFIATSRRDEPELSTMVDTTTIELRQLDRTAAIDVIADQGEIDRDAMDRMLVVADGNPLYLRQSAALGRSEANTPASVDLVLHTRLEHVPRNARLVLEHLAVLDDPSRPELLPLILPEHARTTLPEALAVLRYDGWVEPAETAIVHELLRDAVYGEMTPRARADAHARTAAVLDAEPGSTPERALRLAHHLEASFAAAPSREGADAARIRGRELFAQAARGLEHSGDRHGATAMLDRAVALGGIDDVRGAELAIEHVNNLAQAGSTTDAELLLRERRERIVAVGNEDTKAFLEITEAAIAMWSGGSVDAIARVRTTIERAMPRLEAADHLAGLEVGLYLLAWLAYHRGELAEADERMVRVQELRVQLGTGAPVFVAASLLDGPTPLEETTLRGVLLGVSGSTMSWQAERTAQIAGLYALRGDVDEALRLGAAALELAEALELPSTLGAVEIELGVAQIRLARYDEAIEHLDRAQRAFAEAGDGNFRSTALGQLARAQVFAGDATAALGSVELALDLGDEEDLVTQIASRSAEGLARASAGDAGGVVISREAVERARGTELLVPFCDSLSDLAHACMHAGDRAGASDAATEAIVGFETKHAWGAATSLREAFGIKS